MPTVQPQFSGLYIWVDTLRKDNKDEILDSMRLMSGKGIDPIISLGEVVLNNHGRKNSLGVHPDVLALDKRLAAGEAITEDDFKKTVTKAIAELQPAIREAAKQELDSQSQYPIGLRERWAFFQRRWLKDQTMDTHYAGWLNQRLQSMLQNGKFEHKAERDSLGMNPSAWLNY